MRHPAENWLKYLLSKRAHSYENIRGLMEVIDLGGVNNRQLDVLDEELKSNLPVPFRPRMRTHVASQAYLRKQGIYKAWYRDDAMRKAMDIISNASVRALVEVFILSSITPAQAVAKINESEPHFQLTVEAYERFRHYFWNNTLLSGAEWGDYIQDRDVSHREWLKLAINARGPQGIQLVLWKTGTGALKHLDAGKIFTDFRNIAYMKAKELEMAPAGAEDSKALLNYARVARSAQEEVVNSSDAVRDVLESFNAFKMRRIEPRTESVRALTGGNFTPAQETILLENKIRY